MKKIEREWVEWFAGEYGRRTLHPCDVDGDQDGRVPWDMIEAKGLELGLISTDDRGWFQALKYKWEELCPRDWCNSYDAAVFKGGINLPPIFPKPEPKKPAPEPIYGNPNWYR